MSKRISMTVYTHDEILKHGNPQAIEIMREYLRERSVAHNWNDDIISDWNEKLNSIGFINADIVFTGFCQQGDGASFTSDVDLVKLAKFLSGEDVNKELFDKLKINNEHLLILLKNSDFVIDNYSAKVQRISTDYVHENTCRFKIDDYDSKNQSIDYLKAMGEQVREKLCQMIYNDLTIEYDYLTSDEHIAQYSTDNDCYFKRNGETVKVFKQRNVYYT